jgi:anti-anti-sigma regulatory factor
LPRSPFCSHCFSGARRGAAATDEFRPPRRSQVQGYRRRVVVLVIRAPIAPHDVAALCERLRGPLARGDSIVCDVTALHDPDLGTVDALARLQLTAKRLGGSLRLVGVTPELDGLLGLTGLRDVLGVEVVREAEQREEPLGVEEEADAGDLAAGDREDL